QLVYTSKLSKNFNWKEELKLMLLLRLMKFSIMQKMRFNSKEGGTYSITVGYNPKKSRTFNEFFIQFSCSPDDADRLVKEARQFVNTFKLGSVDSKLLDDYIENMLLGLERKMKSRAFELEKIIDYYRFEIP